MAVNLTLAQVSDLAYQAAMAGYVTALVCHAAEFASRRTPRARQSPSTHPAVAARAGGGTAVLTRSGDQHQYPAGIGPIPAQQPVPWGERFGAAGVVVTLIGFAAHLISIITRGLAVDRAPWGNMYEFTSVITAAAIAVWLIVLLRTRARIVGMFVMFPVTVLVFVGGTVLYTPASSLVPALQSYWLVIHVLAVSLSSGVLMISGVASGLYVLRHRFEVRAGRNPGRESRAQPAGAMADGPETMADDNVVSVLAKLPTLATLDRIAYRTAIIAFPVFTFAVVAGALWAEAAWGRYWGWDPKETTAFVTWVIYAGYLHARATAGWRGVRSAWISILGFVAILFNLFFVNLVVSGLHSYAGLN